MGSNRQGCGPVKAKQSYTENRKRITNSKKNYTMNDLDIIKVNRAWVIHVISDSLVTIYVFPTREDAYDFAMNNEVFAELWESLLSELN